MTKNSLTLDIEGHRPAMRSARPNTGADSSKLFRYASSNDRSRKLNNRLKVALRLVAVSVETSCDLLKSVMIRLSTASGVDWVTTIAINSNTPRRDVVNSVRGLNLAGVDQRFREHVEEGVLRIPAVGIRAAVDLLKEFLMVLSNVDRHPDLPSCQGLRPEYQPRSRRAHISASETE